MWVNANHLLFNTDFYHSRIKKKNQQHFIRIILTMALIGNIIIVYFFENVLSLTKRVK